MVKKKYILIIDDSTTSLMNAKEVLLNNFRLSMCKSGKQGIEMIKKSEDKPDLILLDIDTPNPGGFETLDEINKDEFLSNIPVILLTGANDEVQNEVKGLNMGAMDFIKKPFVPDIMIGRINRILEVCELRKRLEGQVQNKTKELKELNEYTNEIKMMARKDGLTGIFNRSYIEDSIKERLSNVKCGVLFMIDIDDFKSINDSYGHIAGDEVLKKFADIIKNAMGSKGTIGRIGGDEFIAFYESDSNRENVACVANKIINQIGSFEFSFKPLLKVSASIGMAVVPDDGCSFMDLYSKADKALYYVKQNGKQHYHFYSDESEESGSKLCVDADIDAIKKIIGGCEDNKGAYLVEYEGFKNIYKFLERVIERTNDSYQIMLFTITDTTGHIPDTDIVSRAMNTMEDIISNHLRKGDVATNFSSCQYIVILTGVNTRRCDIVAARILEMFRQEFNNEDIIIQYVSSKIVD